LRKIAFLFHSFDDFLQKTYYNWAKSDKLQAPCLKQDKNQIDLVSGSSKQCAICGCYGNRNMSMEPCRAGLSKCGSRLEAVLRSPTQARSQILRFLGKKEFLGGQYFCFYYTF